jgi:sulfatase maturation enzyme AslB (radical SAM superfamily)
MINSQNIQSIEKIGVWLHLTNACNLRCSYCYLPHNPVNMDSMRVQMFEKSLK